jgi:hypothetical protein
MEKSLYQLLKPGDPYQRHWVWFRRRELVRSLIPIIFFTLLITVLSIASALLPDPRVYWSVTMGISLGTVLLIDYLTRLTCPRCRQDFYHPYDKVRFPRERCHHCGLQLFAPHDEL